MQFRQLHDGDVKSLIVNVLQLLSQVLKSQNGTAVQTELFEAKKECCAEAVLLVPPESSVPLNYTFGLPDFYKDLNKESQFFPFPLYEMDGDVEVLRLYMVTYEHDNTLTLRLANGPDAPVLLAIRTLSEFEKPPGTVIKCAHSGTDTFCQTQDRRFIHLQSSVAEWIVPEGYTLFGFDYCADGEAPLVFQKDDFYYLSPIHSLSRLSPAKDFDEKHCRSPSGRQFLAKDPMIEFCPDTPKTSCGSGEGEEEAFVGSTLFIVLTTLMGVLLLAVVVLAAVLVWLLASRCRQKSGKKKEASREEEEEEGEESADPTKSLSEKKGAKKKKGGKKKAAGKGKKTPVTPPPADDPKTGAGGTLEQSNTNFSRLNQTLGF